MKEVTNNTMIANLTQYIGVIIIVFAVRYCGIAEALHYRPYHADWWLSMIGVTVGCILIIISKTIGEIYNN